MTRAAAAIFVASVAAAALIGGASRATITEAAGQLGPPPLGLDLYAPVPPDNPPTPEKVALGARLFFDPILSADGTIACASCHRPDRAFADAGATSAGVRGRRTTRNTPTVLNAAYRKSFFWDGRIRTLEEQVVQPIVNPNEMASLLDAAVGRLESRTDYRSAFDGAFGDGVNAANLARALATYVRTLRSGDSPADRYTAGDGTALDSDARAGLGLFRGRANCVQCHFGPLFSDDRFHNTGVSYGGPDPGRAAVTGDERERGRFRTPSLRDVALTAPYMHDGSMSTLDEVVAFYDRGGNSNPHLDPEIRPLRLTPLERRQLAAYLDALTGRH